MSHREETLSVYKEKWMAYRDEPFSVILKEIKEATGLNKELLTAGELLGKNEKLKTAFWKSRTTRDSKWFIEAWRKFCENQSKEPTEDTLKSLYTNQEIIENLEDYQVKYIEEEFMSHTKICEGWISSGYFKGTEYRYFSKSLENSKNDLVNYIKKLFSYSSDKRSRSNVLLFENFVDSVLIEE